MPPKKRVRIANATEPSIPVRVVTHGPSDPVEIVTSGPSDPIRIVTHGPSDPVRGTFTPPTPPTYPPHLIDAEVGIVGSTVVVLTFDEWIASGGAVKDGWTVEVNGGWYGIVSGALTTPTELRLTLTVPIVYGDVVNVWYNKATGHIVDVDDGLQLDDIISYVTTNNVLPWYLSGGVPLANCIAAYKPKGAANLVASYINCAHPGTHDAILGIAPTWNAIDGWIFDGIAQYLKTGIIIDTDQWTFIFRVSSGSDGYFMGTVDGDGTIIGLAATKFGVITYSYGGTYFALVSLSSGILAINNCNGYKNGIVDAVLPYCVPALTEIYMGAINDVLNSTIEFSATHIQAGVFYDTILSPTEIVAINAAMAAL